MRELAHKSPVSVWDSSASVVHSITRVRVLAKENTRNACWAELWAGLWAGPVLSSQCLKYSCVFKENIQGGNFKQCCDEKFVVCMFSRCLVSFLQQAPDIQCRLTDVSKLHKL